MAHLRALSGASGGLRFVAIWLLLVIPLAMTMMVLTPPIQVPDEQNHFLRAVQIAQGGMIGQRLNPQDSGGFLPPDAVAFAHAFDDLPFHVEKKFSWERLAASQRFSWKGQAVPAGFPNTDIYSPVFYAGSASGVFLGRALHLSVRNTFYLGRFGNLVAYLCAGAAALIIARRGRLFLAVVLSFPMSLHLAASCSQDGALIAGAALVAALLGRLRGIPVVEIRRRRVDSAWIVTGLVLGCVLAAKPPYIPLALLPLLVCRRDTFRDAAACVVIAVLLPVLWTFFGAAPVKVPFLAERGVSAARQLRTLVPHPVHAMTLVMHTLHMFGPSFMEQATGVLGWLDVHLRPPISRAIRLIAVLSIVMGLLPLMRRNVYLDRALALRLVTVSIVICGACASVMLALYLIWTPVGSDWIDGIQGRYFLTPLLFTTVLFPAVAGRTPRATIVVEYTLLIGLVGVDWCGVVPALLQRFW